MAAARGAAAHSLRRCGGLDLGCHETCQHHGVPDFVAPRNPSAVKEKYWALIVDIQNRHDAGALDMRAAHLELSLAVRTFVHEMTGLKTQRMTLSQLREHRLPLAGDAVELFYPAEFSRASGHSSVADSVQTAKNVVSQWR